MSHALLIRPEAEQDLSEARDWYEAQGVGSGADFLTAVDAVFACIQETPALYAAGNRSVRRAKLARFPYVAYFRILGDAVEVLAVLHARRSPRAWRSRI